MCTSCGCSGNSHQHDTLHDARLIEVEKNLLAKNDIYAEKNRKVLEKSMTLALNLVSSPGSGKTSLLTSTIHMLNGELKVSVIEGDQQTDNDAQRIIESGAQAIQINTGKGCHLEAHAVGHALESLDLVEQDIVFIENVGNLVCPAAFDLGEQAKVVVLSVTEGEDKPLKYPDMFKAASLMLINKSDLLPYVDFDLSKTIEYARRINPDIEFIVLSAKNGDGMDQWISWLAHHVPNR
jgi:hydrogenase nickel incorporation protein HypB